MPEMDTRKLDKEFGIWHSTLVFHPRFPLFLLLPFWYGYDILSRVGDHTCRVTSTYKQSLHQAMIKRFPEKPNTYKNWLQNVSGYLWGIYCLTWAVTIPTSSENKFEIETVVPVKENDQREFDPQYL